ncbi:hypothetical protein, partial [Treponema sp. R6D11]
MESREASLEKPETLIQKYDRPNDVSNIHGFISLSKLRLDELRVTMNLAMDTQDILFCQDYFKNSEKRDPTITEIRVLDTYWSDHCRHTTFLTELDEVIIEDKVLRESYNDYLYARLLT